MMKSEQKIKKHLNKTKSIINKEKEGDDLAKKRRSSSSRRRVVRKGILGRLFG